MELKVDENAKALIFDIDGTLVDTMEIHYKAWEKMFAMQGFNYPREVFYELAGIPTYKIVPILNERFCLKLDPEKTMNEKEKYFMESRLLVILQESIMVFFRCRWEPAAERI